MAIATTDFDVIRDLVHRHSGIVLEAGKEYLVESRMHPILRQHGWTDLGELVSALRGPQSRQLQADVVAAMTTNETSFFRDHHPFETLRHDVLPPILERNASTRSLRIWCAASSSGQEPYSIAMTLREHFASALQGWQVEILGTDISDEMLDRCNSGSYSELEVNRGLPAAMMVKYFEREGLEWRITPEVKQLTQFRRLNLVEPWSGLGRFDVVFLRNVLIYFDAETKRGILAQLKSVLNPKASLFLGGAETVINFTDDFEIRRLGRTVVYEVR